MQNIVSSAADEACALGDAGAGSEMDAILIFWSSQPLFPLKSLRRRIFKVF